MDIDLTTDEEIEFRFNQLCACFAILVRDKEEPQDVYLELYHVVNALKEKYCPNKYNTEDSVTAKELKEKLAKMPDEAEVIVSGNCVVCGKQLNCGQLFVCKECELNKRHVTRH